MSLVKALILPPGVFFVLAGLAWWIGRWRPRVRRYGLIGIVVAAYLASTPLVGSALLRSLEVHDAWTPESADPEAGAIVVLGGDLEQLAPEYGGPHIGEFSLQRVRYGARLHRLTGLPLLTTGGRMRFVQEPVGEMMRRALEDEFHVPVRWVESRSQTTFENATGAAELLADAGIRRVYVVTHAWHMPRAMIAFRKAGLEPVPAPTVFRVGPHPMLTEWLPSSKGLQDTTFSLHEWIGRAWYSLRDAPAPAEEPAEADGS